MDVDDPHSLVQATQAPTVAPLPPPAKMNPSPASRTRGPVIPRGRIPRKAKPTLRAAEASGLPFLDESSSDDSDDDEEGGAFACDVRNRAQQQRKLNLVEVEVLGLNPHWSTTVLPPHVATEYLIHVDEKGPWIGNPLTALSTVRSGSAELHKIRISDKAQYGFTSMHQVPPVVTQRLQTLLADQFHLHALLHPDQATHPTLTADSPGALNPLKLRTQEDVQLLETLSRHDRVGGFWRGLWCAVREQAHSQYAPEGSPLAYVQACEWHALLPSEGDWEKELPVYEYAWPFGVSLYWFEVRYSAHHVLLPPGTSVSPDDESKVDSRLMRTFVDVYRLHPDFRSWPSTAFTEAVRTLRHTLTKSKIQDKPGEHFAFSYKPRNIRGSFTMGKGHTVPPLEHRLLLHHLLRHDFVPDLCPAYNAWITRAELWIAAHPVV